VKRAVRTRAKPTSSTIAVPAAKRTFRMARQHGHRGATCARTAGISRITTRSPQVAAGCIS
jgi:hypothetical protein